MFSEGARFRRQKKGPMSPALWKYAHSKVAADRRSRKGGLAKLSVGNRARKARGGIEEHFENAFLETQVHF